MSIPLRVWVVFVVAIALVALSLFLLLIWIDYNDSDYYDEDEEEYGGSLVDFDNPLLTIEGNDSSLRYNRKRFSF